MPTNRLANEKSPRLQADPVACRGVARLKRAVGGIFAAITLRLAKYPQRRLVEITQRDGLPAIGQNPQEQPARQMGGSRPAQMVPPLEAKRVGVEIGEARDHVVKRWSRVRRWRRARRGLPNAGRMPSPRHHAA